MTLYTVDGGGMLPPGRERSFGQQFSQLGATPPGIQATASPGVAQNPTGAGGMFGSTFNIPLDLFPNSTSTQSSGSSSHGSSGINWDTDFMKELYPSLLGSATGLQGNVDKMGETIQGQYSNLMRQGMGPNAFQGSMNSLANRNMLTGNVASDALSQAGQGIAQNIGNQQFASNLAQQGAQMQVPGILAQIAGLGQESESSGSSGSTSTSQSSNPLAPYELMANMMTY